MTTQYKKKGNSNVNQKIGIVLVLAGLVYMFSQMIGFRLSTYSWPFFVIVPGLAVLVGSLAIPGKLGRILSGVGAVTASAGGLLLYQSGVNRFETWAYAWALVVPVAIGLSQLLYGSMHSDDRIVAFGRNLAIVGAVLFVAGFIFFELVLNLGGYGVAFPRVGRYFGPACIIIIGAWLLLFGNRSSDSGA